MKPPPCVTINVGDSGGSVEATAQVKKRRRSGWSALACSAVLLVGCGSESNTAATTSPASLEAAPTPTTTPPTTTSPTTTTTSAPASEDELAPAVACQLRQPASEEVIVRETDPETTTWAYDLGGGWIWDFGAEECITSVQMILRTVPLIDGYCVEVAPKSANPGYDLNADPAPPLHGVIGRGGDC